MKLTHVLLALLILCALGCVTAKPAAKAEPTPVVTWDMLDPEMQERIRPMLGPGDDKEEWLKIVRATCKVSATANCVCCQESTKRLCNPTNWSCCGSAVFSPADASSCAIPDPCKCPAPPVSL